MLVCLVYLVYLVYLVDLVSFVQPIKQDKPNKLDRPNEQGILLDFHVNNVGHPQVDDLRCSRARLNYLRPHVQGSILADSLGKPHDHVSIGQRRLYRVADGRASLVIGQPDPIRSVNEQFIEALFEFEEQLRK